MPLSSRVIHLTFYKCGSQWVRDVLSAPELADFTKLSLEIGGGNLLTTEWPGQKPGTIHAPLYNASFEDWTRHREATDRAVIVLRDPRDQIISTMFSWTHSHAEDVYVEAARKPLLALSVPHRLQFSISMFSRIEKAFHSWAGRKTSTSEYVTSYENLLADEHSEFKKIFAFLEWNVPENVVASVVNRLSFSARSGRQKGHSDVHSHYRNGVSGDWKNYFTRELGHSFEQLYPRLLIKLGYETDPLWFEQLLERLPDLKPQSIDEAAYHTLAAENARLREHSIELGRNWHALQSEAEKRLVSLNQVDDNLVALRSEMARLSEELARRDKALLEKEAALMEIHAAAHSRMESLLEKQAVIEKMEKEICRHEKNRAAVEQSHQSALSEAHLSTQNLHQAIRESAGLKTELARLHDEIQRRDETLAQKETILRAIHEEAELRLKDLNAKQATLEKMHRENAMLHKTCQERDVLLSQQNLSLRELARKSSAQHSANLEQKELETPRLPS